jgi:3-carboxy-cis,cis-muconate cycloisomerase
LPSDLFSATYERGDAVAAVNAEAWLQALLDVEAALARACATEGLIPEEAQNAITAACASAADFDLVAIAAEAGDHATPVVPLVRILRERVGPDNGRYVHVGATSQDIVDTAAMLVAKRALTSVLADARAAADACAGLAERHRQTAVAGRTLLQQALPTSFGLVAAQWLTAIAAPLGGLEGMRSWALAVQMGGPVGSRSPAVADQVADYLDLAAPRMPWHTDRTRVVALAATLGMLGGSLGKIARDVTLFAQTEVGELSEGGEGRGGSSAMAHKHNPVAAVSVLACSKRLPGLVATMLAAMEQEHERAAGAWQAEWGTLTQILTLTGSAAAWSRDLLENLEVDVDRMRANLGSLAEAGVADAASPEQHLSGALELIDRALKDYRG